MEKSKEQTRKQFKGLKLSPATFELLESVLIPNFTKPLFSNSLMTVYPATSRKKSDNATYSVQKIENIPKSSVVCWIRRWNHILEIMKTKNSGILSYLTCHIEKNLVTESSTIYFVSEPIITTLREAKSKLSLSLVSLVKAMLQITETLLQLQKSGYSHYNINTDTIVVVGNKDGTYSYKLANLCGWMKTHEIPYSQRLEYSHTIPLDYDSLNPTSKSDVYSLGITIMEIIGVSAENLVNHKTKCVDPGYKHDTYSMQGFMEKLLLEAVHPDPEKRISLENLRDGLSARVEFLNEPSKLNYDGLCARLRSIPLVPYSKSTETYRGNEQHSEASKKNGYILDKAMPKESETKRENGEESKGSTNSVDMKAPSNKETACVENSPGDVAIEIGLGNGGVRIIHVAHKRPTAHKTKLDLDQKLKV